MTNEELKKYYNAQKLQGRSESQIARSLGMSLTHFMGKLKGVDVDKIDPPKPKKNVVSKHKGDLAINPNPAPMVVPKDESKKEEPKPAEDLSWMDD